MKIVLSIAAIIIATVICTSCKKNKVSPGNTLNVVKANGDISDDIEEFRNLLGGPVNKTPGVKGGRREINWDGVPESLENKALPLNFFNPMGNTAEPTQQRGLNYSAEGAFMVSSNGFSSINANAASQFTAFSGTKVFANTAAAQWQVDFQEAGSTVDAAVQGFGMVFSDVDKPNSTSLEFFNGNKSLGKYFVPIRDATSNFSFLGLYINSEEKITKVTVTHDGFLAEGTQDISDNGSRDLVVIDDIFYSEPVAK